MTLVGVIASFAQIQSDLKQFGERVEGQIAALAKARASKQYDASTCVDDLHTAINQQHTESQILRESVNSLIDAMHAWPERIQGAARTLELAISQERVSCVAHLHHLLQAHHRDLVTTTALQPETPNLVTSIQLPSLEPANETVIDGRDRPANVALPITLKATTSETPSNEKANAQDNCDTGFETSPETAHVTGAVLLRQFQSKLTKAHPHPAPPSSPSASRKRARKVVREADGAWDGEYAPTKRARKRTGNT